MQVTFLPLSPDYYAATYHAQSSGYFLSGGEHGFDTEAKPLPEQRERGEGRPLALVVDDAPDVTEMLAMFLRHAGYDTVMAFSAAEALETAQGNQFEVVVSDIGMPGMNGYDLAAALRALPGYREVPMIAVTGFSMYDDRGRAIASGFNAHLTKPINPEALLTLIKSFRD